MQPAALVNGRIFPVHGELVSFPRDEIQLQVNGLVNRNCVHDMLEKHECRIIDIAFEIIPWFVSKDNESEKDWV